MKQVAQLQDELKKLGLPIKGMLKPALSRIAHSRITKQQARKRSSFSASSITDLPVRLLSTTLIPLTITAGVPAEAADEQQDEVGGLSIAHYFIWMMAIQ